MSAASPIYDLVTFGATSFVGRILTGYLLEEFGAHGELKWAAAGRSAAKLEELRSSLGPKAATLPLLVADAGDESALRTMCAQTRVVASTVGPYALFGEPLVRVCAETGTDYCDLTGETQWTRRMVDRYQDTAQASGARIVHGCGFDSIPSDLGVYFLQQESRRRLGRTCSRVKMRVKAIRGGVSGGTAASALNAIKELAADPPLRKELASPYALCPKGDHGKVRQPNVKFVEYDADFESWIAPFVMGPINIRIVHRSNSLSNHAYGADFRYDEAVLTGRGFEGRLRAAGIAAVLAGLVAAGAIGPLRAALERFVVPAPGAGPSPEAQTRGFYDLRFLGLTDDGRRLSVKVTGDRDPGYGSTSRILGQAAASLALDLRKPGAPGGIWTPATLFGDRLFVRLEKHSGLAFAVIEG